MGRKNQIRTVNTVKTIIYKNLTITYLQFYNNLYFYNNHAFTMVHLLLSDKLNYVDYMFVNS